MRKSSLFLIILLAFSFVGYIPQSHAMSATGGTITYSGPYTIHTFTTSGTFTVTSAGDVDYLVIGAGGGGGTLGGGGGGSGDFRNGTSHAVTVQAYTITVGAGGAGSAVNANDGANGGSSTFDTITSVGGGGGASGSSGAGANGASGGGGVSWTNTAGGTATGVAGTNGGSSSASVVDYYGGSGGGTLTAGAVGDAACAAGGLGRSTDISGTSTNYAAGGSSGSVGGGACASKQGIGGAGSGTGNGSNAVANSGSGGGGSGSTFTGGNGGSGIVIIRYIATAAPPDPVTDLTSTSIGETFVNLDWTAPSAGGGGQYIIGYQINATTPQTNNPLVLVNDTGTTNTDYAVIGLTSSTAYSFRVTAWGNNTADHPFNNAGGNVYNATTSAIIIPVAPVLTKVFPLSYTSTSQLNLEWTAPSMSNINGYKIERQDNGGAWGCVITCNTTNTNVFYNNTGLSTDILYNYRVYALNGTSISQASNTFLMTTFKLPNAVTDLVAVADAFSAIILTWTAPTHFAPAITDYQINYTQPAGDPQIIFTHTPITIPSVTVTGLEIGGNYSFRVSAITFHGKNATGNIANATTTTIFDPSDLGDPDVTNTNDFSIFYNQTNTNATSILLDVNYPSSYTLSCNILQKFSGGNNTYTGLTETPVAGYGDDTDTVQSSFIFNGPNTEVITVNCRDAITGDSAKYIITVTDFELKKQLGYFRDGTYGTTGQIGGLDLITLIIVIIGMIGFNRVTPVAGVVFTCITVGVAAYFEFIEFYQIMFPALALIVLLAYTRTRQTD